jgi:hypothetical protein
VTFTKLFSSITASTVWCLPSDTRVVWITMLAMADRHGRVWASIPGLAKEAAVSVDACRTAIDEFLSPDPDSRTKVAEGRRIEPIDGGWRIINHAKYRAIRDQEERKAYKAEKQREYRAVDKVDKCGHRGPDVDRCAHNAEAEAEADTEAKEQKPSRAKARATKEPSKTALHKTRHAEFKEAVRIYWKTKNEIDMPWGPAEARQLDRVLKESPYMTIDIFRAMLRNRYKSSVNHGDRPSQWLFYIASYGPGPVNQFKNTAQEVTNGTNHSSPAKERLHDNRLALAKAAVKRGWIKPDDFAGKGAEALAEPGHSGVDGGIFGGLRETGPEILPPDRD